MDIPDKKYKLGYCMGILDENCIKSYEWLREQAALCDKFILGIPNEWIMARLYPLKKKYKAKKAKQFWMSVGWFSDVIILDAEHLRYQKIYEELQFDACFYGSEYGLPFEEDKSFMEKKGVSFLFSMLEMRTGSKDNEIAMLEEFAIAAAKENIYLKRSHEILLALLKEFDRVCQKNGIHYYVTCGTLIGVIRHQDLIPWDDDVDVAMPRKDFQKLKKIAKKEWNNDTFRFLNYTEIGGSAFWDCMPRLFYMKEHLPTKCFDKVSGKANKELKDRMFIDIYVMDNAHENELIHDFTINAMKGIYNLMMGHRAFIDYDVYKNLVPDSTIRLMKCLHKIGCVLPICFLAFWYDTFSRSANLNRKCKNYIMGTGLIRYIGRKLSKEIYGEGLRMPLADIEVMVPQDYDALLCALGHPNYMKLPRMARRKPSHYFNSDIEVI